MLGLGLVLGLFSALLDMFRTRGHLCLTRCSVVTIATALFDFEFSIAFTCWLLLQFGSPGVASCLAFSSSGLSLSPTPAGVGGVGDRTTNVRLAVTRQTPFCGVASAAATATDRTSS